MIKVTDIAGTEKYLNCDMIERIELVPDTLVVLLNGHHIILRDSPQALIDRIVEFRRRIGGTLCHFPVVEDKKAAYSIDDAGGIEVIQHMNNKSSFK